MNLLNNIKIKPALIPEIEVRLLCATFLEAIRHYYENPDNHKAFLLWKRGNKNGKNHD